MYQGSPKGDVERQWHASMEVRKGQPTIAAPPPPQLPFLREWSKDQGYLRNQSHGQQQETSVTVSQPGVLQCNLGCAFLMLALLVNCSVLNLDSWSLHQLRELPAIIPMNAFSILITLLVSAICNQTPFRYEL